MTGKNTTSTGFTVPRIGLLDVETAPLNADVWGLFDQNVGLNQINTEWSILSYTVKTLSPGALTQSDRLRKAQCQYYDTSTAEGGPRDDRELCQKLWQELHDYDILIAHNGDRFDLRKIRARLIIHGMQPPAPVRTIDTLKIARGAAAFTSNKLEWLARYLSRMQKSSHKKFPGHSLWTECLKGNPEAWKEMRAYNVPDVLSMEEVYLRLRPWAKNHPNVAAYYSDDKVRCPVCGSAHVTQDGRSHSNVSVYHRYHCEECGAWSRGRFTTNTSTKRKALLTKE